MQRNAVKCRETKKNAEKRRERQRNVEKFRKMHRNAVKCRETKTNAKTQREIQRNAEKFREMYPNVLVDTFCCPQVFTRSAGTSRTTWAAAMTISSTFTSISTLINFSLHNPFDDNDNL